MFGNQHILHLYDVFYTSVSSILMPVKFITLGLQVPIHRFFSGVMSDPFTAINRHVPLKTQDKAKCGI